MNAQLKEKTVSLTAVIIEKYKTLSENEIKQIVVNDKWLTDISEILMNEMQNITQKIATDVTELVERYEHKLSDIEAEVSKLEKEVAAHLAQMGFKL